MRASLSLLIAATLCTAAAAQTNVTEDITTDTTWDVGGSPYIVNQMINVLSGSTLTIEAGVTVKLDSMAQIRTSPGAPIVAVGAPGNEILFTSGADSPAPNDWFAIHSCQAAASVFTHCIFEYGRYNMYSDGDNPTITSCTSRYSHYSGFTCEDASPTITSCTATGCEDGIKIFSGYPVITGCEISGNNEGIYISGPDAGPVIHNCNIYDNSWQNMYVRGFTGRPVVIIDAQNNWWGVDTAPEIEATIVIASSSVGFVEIDYDPWLPEVPVETTSWARVKALFAE